MLGLVVTGEIGYLVAVKKNPSAVECVSQANTSSASSSANICASPTPLPSAAVDPLTIKMLGFVKDDILTSSILTNDYRGEILEIVKKQSIAHPNEDIKFQYDLKIKLKGEKGNTNDLWFNKEDMDKLTRDSRPLDQLKVGDTINVTLILNLKKNLIDNLISAKIIKVK